MKRGDLVRYRTPDDHIGIILEIRMYRPTKDRGPYSHHRMSYSFEMLESNGTRNWYDVWVGDDILPEVIK